MVIRWKHQERRNTFSLRQYKELCLYIFEHSSLIHTEIQDPERAFNVR